MPENQSATTAAHTEQLCAHGLKIDVRKLLALGIPFQRVKIKMLYSEEAERLVRLVQQAHRRTGESRRRFG
jgi:hypothetical protein